MDLQREEFYGRISRLSDDKGEGPKRSSKHQSGKIASGNWIAPVAMILASVVTMKAVVHANVGADSYNHRIALLAEGDGADKIGAWVLSADPITVALSEFLRGLAS